MEWNPDVAAVYLPSGHVNHVVELAGKMAVGAPGDDVDVYIIKLMNTS